MGLKKNDFVTVTIEDMGADGEGIGRADGCTLFIKDAIIGDVVEAKIMKMKKKYGYARLERVLQPSEKRTTPVCRFYRQCGGCQLQALSYAEQLAFKERKIVGNLERIGHFSKNDFVVEPIVGMEEPFHYRNKAQFPIRKDKEGKLVAGFYAGRTHDIIPNLDCALGTSENARILRIVLNFMNEYTIEPYCEADGTGLVRHVLIRKGFTSGELMVCLVINGESLPHCDRLVEQLRGEEGMKSISINVNQKRTNVILGDEIKVLWGDLYIHDFIGDLRYRISPLSFFQVNPVQTKKLYDLVVQYAQFTGTETVWDLYCGTGSISLYMAKYAKHVFGVEVVPQAIEDARANAVDNGIANASFYVGKAEEVVPELYEKEQIHADVIVVDPPRKGCDSSLLHTMLQMSPEKIVYVSCDSATLARDLRVLCDGGYRLEKVRGVDCFSQTVHVETVVLLSQQKPDDVIEVEIELDELDLTSAESKATYKEIQEYVLEKFGIKVSNLYISQVKRKCGIEVGVNYNLPKSEDSKQPQCPEEKEKAIKDALEHFGMI